MAARCQALWQRRGGHVFRLHRVCFRQHAAAAPPAALDKTLASLLQLEPSGPPTERGGQKKEAVFLPQWSQLKRKLEPHQLQGSRCAYVLSEFLGLARALT